MLDVFLVRGRIKGCVEVMESASAGGGTSRPDLGSHDCGVKSGLNLCAGVENRSFRGHLGGFVKVARHRVARAL